MTENQILVGDCLPHLKSIPDQTFDLTFSDPPFNDGYAYDIYKDDRSDADYFDWCESWMTQIYRTLKDDGTFWLAIGDHYVSDLDILAKSLGFIRRSWVIWHYTFGVNATKNFTPSHTHLLYYIKSDTFTFNTQPLLVPSARQTKYADKRASPGGRLPNNTWVLDSKELAESHEGFFPSSDTWYASRLCGTFRERSNHPCQMPEAILERIVLSTSNPGDFVLDPMAGSGTTLAVAKRLSRRYLGMELSPAYVNDIRTRLSQTAIEQAS